MRLGQLIAACGSIAPEALREEWDNVGLQVGDPDASVSRVLISLDVTPEVVAEAAGFGAQCVVAHHPLLFRPLRSLREDRPEGRLPAQLIRAGIALYVMHTNLDVARPGTSDALAALLDVMDLEPLVPASGRSGGSRLKLVTFAPAADAERIRAALGDAGAGVIGRYSHCSFSSPGTGSFRPLPGAHPTIGAVGTQEQVQEERIEVVVPAGSLPHVVDALLAAHPYEEVAYDLYPLAQPPDGTGLGRVGRLPASCSLAELAGRVRERLPATSVAVVGDAGRQVQRVALCGGSGGDLVDAAAGASADVLITGDVKHHQALHALDAGLAVIDAGHYGTERPVLDLLATLLCPLLPTDVEVRISAVNTDPFAK